MFSLAAWLKMALIKPQMYCVGEADEPHGAPRGLEGRHAVEVKGAGPPSPVRRVDGMELDLSSPCPKLLVYGRRDEYVSEGELEEAPERISDKLGVV
jgi:hypothetical protein